MRFRSWALLLLACPPCSHALLAQPMMPVGVVQGRFISSTVSAPGSASSDSAMNGDLIVQRADGATYSCTFDAHTLIQRDQWPVHVDVLRAGDPVEVISDRKSGSMCYARMVTATTLPSLPEPRRRPAKKLENVPSKGNLTFSGTVIKSDEAGMTVRTKTGEHTFALLGDTRFSSDGVKTERPAPLVNKHVFVRAGRDAWGMLEAYQVMWGEILFAP